MEIESEDLIFICFLFPWRFLNRSKGRRRERLSERGREEAGQKKTQGDGASEGGVSIGRDKGASISVEYREAVSERWFVRHGRNLCHSTRGHDQGIKLEACFQYHR